MGGVTCHPSLTPGGNPPACRLAAALHQAGAPKHGIDGRAQGFRAVDDEQAPAFRVDAALDQALEQVLRRRAVLGRAFLDPQNVLVALVVHPHRPDYALVVEMNAVDIDDQQIHIVKPAIKQFSTYASDA